MVHKLLLDRIELALFDDSRDLELDDVVLGVFAPTLAELRIE